MNRRHKFTAAILAARGGGAFAEVPFDVEETFGSKRPQVKVTIGREQFITNLTRMGHPCHIVPIPKAVRDKTGKTVGDDVEITVQPDNTPKTILVPADMAQALARNPNASAFFEKLSFSHRKEYVRWIEDAKKPETRSARLAKTIERLNAGIKGV